MDPMVKGRKLGRRLDRTFGFPLLLMSSATRRPHARGNQLRRRLDHAFGSPLLFLLSVIRRPRAIPNKITTIGIITCSAIGDTIVATAMVRDLKSAIPDCHVIGFIPGAARGITSVMEGFDQEVVLPISRPFEALRVIRNFRTDVLIDILAWPRMTALVAALANTDFTIGFETDGQHRHFAYDAAVRHLRSRHEVENYRALLEPLGIIGTHYPRAHAARRKTAPTSSGGRKAVVLHPWASGFRSSMREWPLDRWAKLARDLIAEGANVVITGGPSDRQRAETLSAMIDRAAQVTVLAGRADLLETTERLADAELVISVNTGTMHLAAALDQNLVALHGPTDPVRWGPLSNRATIVGPGPGEGGAYLNLGFEYPRNALDCMSLIDVNEVRDLALRHISSDYGNVDNVVSRSALAVQEKRPFTNNVGIRSKGALADFALDGAGASGVRSARPTLSLPPPLLARRSAIAKRAVDISVAVLLLTFMLPSLLAIAAAIKLESQGPVLFRQTRYGYNGTFITVWKFRSMYHDVRDENCQFQTRKNDPRLTRIGAFLRKYSLDELPQLFNVLRGDMSLVGPRPHAISTNVNGVLLEDLVDSYRLRYRAKPGITGLAQISGARGPLDTVEKVISRVERDLWYISNWSLWLDIRILLWTAKSVWLDSTAY